ATLHAMSAKDLEIFRQDRVRVQELRKWLPAEQQKLFDDYVSGAHAIVQATGGPEATGKKLKEQTSRLMVEQHAQRLLAAVGFGTPAILDAAQEAFSATAEVAIQVPDGKGGQVEEKVEAFDGAARQKVWERIATTYAERVNGA